MCIHRKQFQGLEGQFSPTVKVILELEAEDTVAI